jgi:hypothetical protein
VDAGVTPFAVLLKVCPARARYLPGENL